MVVLSGTPNSWDRRFPNLRKGVSDTRSVWTTKDAQVEDD